VWFGARIIEKTGPARTWIGNDHDTLI